MLNETASRIDDRPITRQPQLISARPEQQREAGQRAELRQLVGSVMAIERDFFPSDAAAPAAQVPGGAGDWLGFGPAAPPPAGQRPTLEKMGETLMQIGGDSQYIGSFEGRLLYSSQEAYDKLDVQLRGREQLALFREGDLIAPAPADPAAPARTAIIHVIAGRPRVSPRSPWINLVLLLATLFSVLIVGTNIAIGEIRLVNPVLAGQLEDNFFGELWRGAPYAISILLILGAHELGHYFAARHHKIAVTLPYFIPAPFISPLGTFGAFIQLREPMKNRRVLLDVGAAGPLSGLIFAIPILFIGLATSSVSPIQPGAALEGNSLLYALAKTLVFGRFLPDGQVDVLLNQLAWAGWTGLLVTSLNLIPLGQLDGGHILFSLIGDAARKLYFPLMAVMIGLVFLVSDVWLFWVILLLLFGRVYAAPLDMITPLDQRRRWIALLGLVVFMVTFLPVPFTTTPEAGPPAIRDSVWLLPLAVGLITAWTRRR